MENNSGVKTYLDQFSPEFREILHRLRELIYEVVPDAKEAIKWNMPTFSFRNKIICNLAGFKNHVSLTFYNGTMLNDPDGLLQGSGKYMKFIRFRSMDDLDEGRLRAWIMEGFYT